MRCGGNGGLSSIWMLDSRDIQEVRSRNGRVGIISSHRNILPLLFVTFAGQEAFDSILNVESGEGRRYPCMFGKYYQLDGSYLFPREKQCLICKKRKKSKMSLLIRHIFHNKSLKLRTAPLM